MRSITKICILGLHVHFSMDSLFSNSVISKHIFVPLNWNELLNIESNLLKQSL